MEPDGFSHYHADHPYLNVNTLFSLDTTPDGL
jgi:hypothetical protein